MALIRGGKIDRSKGESIFGGGKGAISWNVYPKKQETSSGSGSTAAPAGESASNEIENWMLKNAQQRIANEAAQSSTEKQGQTQSKP